MKHFISFIVALSSALAGWSAHAQTAAPAGSTDLGKQIAASGTPGGAAACASCHGAQGEGNAAGGFPRIAGQSQAYLAHQLAAYADGSRSNAVMMPIAKALTQQQIDAVSAYYATLSPQALPPASQPAANVMKRGQQLANVGDDRISVQGCANCHGPGGIGQPPTYPYLASQIGQYLTASLNEWKSGARKTDPSQQMNMIAKRLSDSDMAAVAAYFAAQPAPPPAAALLASIPAGSAARPAAPGAPTQPSVPTQGVGTEQGAPTTGGGQGPGGGGGASGAGPSGSPTGEAR